VTAYKFLGPDRTGRFSDLRWPAPGEWVEVAEPIADCEAGVHALRYEQLLDWIDDELWEIELDGALLSRDAMLIAERGRLTRRIDAWDAEAARAFALGCARRSAAHGAAVLRAAGHDEHADRLAAADDPDAILAAAVAALDVLDDEHEKAVVAFSADMAELIAGKRPDTWLNTGAPVRAAQTAGAVAANAGFVAAHVAGFAAGGDESAYATGFAAERARQLEELARLAGL
jgi:hypothetical protein